MISDEPLIVGRSPTPIKWDGNNPWNELLLELIKSTSHTDLTRRLDNLRHRRMWGPWFNPSIEEE